MLKYWAKGKDREGKNRVSGLLVTVWLLWNFVYAPAPTRPHPPPSLLQGWASVLVPVN